MWADSKTVWVLKYGSTIQKLFDAEKRRPTPFLHKNNVRGNFEHLITFKLLNQISKTKLFWNLPTSARQDIIFNYFIILCI